MTALVERTGQFDTETATVEVFNMNMTGELICNTINFTGSGYEVKVVRHKSSTVIGVYTCETFTEAVATVTNEWDLDKFYNTQVESAGLLALGSMIERNGYAFRVR